MDKKLLTPGPLTTSISTKEAMLHDWGSRDQKFIDLNQSIRDSLIKLIDGEDSYQCVPMQGSGTFAVESMVSSLTPKDAQILILIRVSVRLAVYCAAIGCSTFNFPEECRAMRVIKRKSPTQQGEENHTTTPHIYLRPSV